MRKCPKCGRELQEKERFCVGCGTDVRAVVDIPKEKPSKPPKPKKAKNPEKTARVLLSIGKIAVLVILVAVLIGGIFASLYLSLRQSAQLTADCGENTTYSDGVLSVALEFEQGALLFENSSTARMNLVLTNESASIIRDLTLDLDFPEVVQYLGAEKTVTVDLLAPGASCTLSLPVEQVTAINTNFRTSLFILIGVAVICVLLTVLYALLSSKYGKVVRSAVVIMLVAAMLLPNVLTVASALDDDSYLVYADGSDVATGIATNYTTESTFSLGDGDNCAFGYTAQYVCEQYISLDASSDDETGAVTLYWDEISGAQRYHIYTADFDGDFYELTTTRNTSYTLSDFAKNQIALYRVVAETDIGDIYTNDLRLIVNEGGKLFADNDGDLLSNEYEKAFGTSLVLEDSDGDGISDYNEVALTMTNPLLADSDGNGISDGDEDPDGDGLSNLEELAIGTAPLTADTDHDGADDKTESKLSQSDPLNSDTDGDGLLDGSEYAIGTNPIMADTDGDGIDDADDQVDAVITDENNPDVKLNATDTGDNLTASEIVDITDNTVFADRDYIASPVVSVEVTGDADAEIVLPITGTIEDDEIIVVVYNEENNDFVILPDCVVSEDGKSICVPVSNEYVTEHENGTDTEKTVTTYRSTYAALYVANWHAAFSAALSPDRAEEAFFDVSFVIDESGSMEDSSKSTPNDPNRYRVSAAQSFLNALVEGDRAAVVGFSDDARRKCYLTNDFAEASTAIDAIVGNAGGTAMYTGLQEALDELVANYDESRGRFIIALTDGEDNSSNDEAYNEIIATCNEYDIPIFTIGLGSSVNTALLTKLATYTGGAYCHIQTAEDLPQVFNRIENTAFYGDDTDGDTLADSVETHGLRDGTGEVFVTDPNTAFTDGDDLSDGEEAGNVLYSETDEDGTILAYYLMLTDPTLADTDGDGVDDLDETVMKTLPWCCDTDHDGLTDGEELALGYDPLEANVDGDDYNDYLEYLCADLSNNLETIINNSSEDPMAMVFSTIIGSISYRDPYSYDLSAAEKGVALLEGALLGDFGDILAKYDIVDSRHTESIYYYLGGVIIGFIPIAEDIASVRDAVASVIEGDLWGAVTNVITLVVPMGKGVAEAVELILDVVDYVQDGLEATAEYPSKLSVQKVAAAPALTYLLLRLYRMFEQKFGIDLDTDKVYDLVQSQIDVGLRGLVKSNVENWEAFLSYGDQTMDDDVASDWVFSPWYAQDALQTHSTVADTISVQVSNTCLAVELLAAVREKLDQHAGGKVISDETGAEYVMVRVLDLECTEYQDAFVLEAALKDSIDRVAGFADSSYESLSKRLQLVVTDSMVSESCYDILADIGAYAEEKGVTLECFLYMTTDDNDYNLTLDDVEPSERKSAIIVLPGISASELVAGEDYTGSFTSITAGENVWTPDVLTDVFQGSWLDFADDIWNNNGVLEIVDALNMLQMDARGNSLYSIQPKTVTVTDTYVGAMGTGSAMYTELVAAFYNTDENKDVVFFSYDWRKSVSNAAKDLRSYISARGYDDVTFVCHSMGGVVCSYYLTMEHDVQVNQVITIGTPYGGAPKAALVFETGQFMEFRVQAVDYAFMQIARNLPSVYDLLPYNASIGGNGAYLATNNITSYDAQASVDYLKNNDFDLNEDMIDASLAVQETLYAGGTHIMNSEDVNCTIIAGYNSPTVTKLFVNGAAITATGTTLAGDGTVPLVSAIECAGALFDNPIYLVDGVDHSALFSDPGVIELVVALIKDKTLPLDQYSYISTLSEEEQSSSDVMKRVENGETATKDEVSDIRDCVSGDIYDILVAYCPVTLTLYDAAGQMVGSVSSEGISVTKESDASFFELLNGGESKQVIVPQGYTVKVTGESDGTMDLMVATMTKTGDMAQMHYYQNLAVSAAMDVDVAIEDHTPNIKIDIDGDGKIEQELTAEDAVKEIYIPIDSGASGVDSRVWVLVGISGGMILAFAVAILVITLVTRPKKKKA